MKVLLFCLLGILCCTARAETLSDDSDSEAAAPSEADNPSSGRPDEAFDNPKILVPKTRVPVKPREITRQGREITSKNYGESETQVKQPRSSAPVVRLGLYGGYAKLSSSDATIDSARGNQGLGGTYPVGLTAEARAWRYLGADLDGYFSVAPTQNVVGGSGSSSTSASKQLQMSGFSFLVKGIYPFDRYRTRWYPTVGIGYGFQQLSHSETSNSVTISDQMAARGLLGSLGLAVEIGKDWLLNADAQFSVGASGNVTETGGTAPFDLTGSASTFRGRLGVAYQVAPHFYVGTTLLMRTLSVLFSSGSVPAPTASSTQPNGNPETQMTFALNATYGF